MKCFNPKCPAPTYVETLSESVRIQFCPICGSSLDPSLNSPDDSRQNEDVNPKPKGTVEQAPPDQDGKESKGIKDVEDDKKSNLGVEDWKESQGVKDGEDDKESKGVKDGKDGKESKDVIDGEDGTESNLGVKDVNENGKGVKDGEDDNESQGVKDGEDDKESQGVKDGKDGKESKDVIDGEDGTESNLGVKDVNENGKGVKDGEDDNESQGVKDGEDDKESQGVKDGKDGKESKDVIDGKNNKERRSVKDVEDGTESNLGVKDMNENGKESKGVKDGKDGKESKDVIDGEDGTESNLGVKDVNENGKGVKDGEDEKESKCVKGSKDDKENKGVKDEKSNKGGKDVKDSNHKSTFYRPLPSTGEHNKPEEKTENTVDTNKESSKGATHKGSSQVQDNYMTIVFHALLAPHFQCDPKLGDKVVVRGGQPHFKGWKKDELEMKPIRSLPYNYILIEGRTTIQLNYASRLINYKYLVINKDDNKELWEELIDCHSVFNKGYVNRCFRIPERYHKKNGVWHQYDDVVFSQPKFWESIRNKFPYIKAMDPSEGREIAIQAFLPDWDSFDVDKTSGKRKSIEVLETINQVIYCMKNAQAEMDGEKPWFRVPSGFSLNEVVLSYITPRLKKNKKLARNPPNNEHIHAHRIATSLAIASVVSSLLTDPKHFFCPTRKQLKDIFKCLAINVCFDRQSLKRVMGILAQYYPRDSWETLSMDISKLCQFAVAKHLGVYEWLLAVPLMYFLSDISQPGTEVSLPEATPEVTSYCGTKGIDLTGIKKTLSSAPTEFLHELKPMFDLDQNLKMTFFLSLPLTYMGHCVKQGGYRTLEVCMTLVHMMQKKVTFYSSEEVSSIEDCFEFMLNDISHLDTEKYENQKSNLVHNKDELIPLAKGSLEILKCVLLIHLKDPSGLKLACCVLNFLSKSLSLVKSTTISVTSSNGKNKAEQTENDNAICAEILKEVTVKVRHSLSKAFLGHSMISHYIDDELKIWTVFLSVQFSDHALQTSWQTALIEGLNNYINKMNDMQKIEFYSKIKFVKFHVEVERCFQEAAFDAITKITEFPDSHGFDNKMAPSQHIVYRETHRELDFTKKAEHEKAFKSLCRQDNNSLHSKKSNKVGEMMSLLLERCWPKESEQDILLSHILTWSPMANYMRYFIKISSTEEKIFTEDSIGHLVLTKSCLEDIHRKIWEATITVNTLRILRKKQERYYELVEMLQLSSADYSKADEIKKNRDKTDDEQDKEGDIRKRCNHSRTTLQKRLDELLAFEEERSKIRLFLNLSSIIQHVDVNDLKCKVETNVAAVLIERIAVTVCTQTNTKEIQVIFFGLSNELKSMVTKMYQIHESKLFNVIWNNNFKDFHDGKQTLMTLDDVETQVWSPTYTKCSLILQEVLTGNITLANVDTWFGSLKGRNLVEDLQIIMYVCGEKDNLELLNKQVNEINQYQRLTKCIAAADKVLKFKEEMNLNGDFEMVNIVRQQISPKSKEKPLKTFRGRFQEIGKSLEKLTDDRLECLDAVIESKEFVKWLKEEVPDPSEINVLVDLAMMSAGEGDIESDRIAALHTCTRGFKPLIYDLNVNDGFERLMELCEGIWKVLKRNPKLPQQMRDTGRRLEWLKNVKEFHGSVAMSSLKQVETINKHGILTIGCHGNGEEIDINTVISLKVPQDKVKSLQKETYSLEDLKDLQSKLMLIAGKSSGAKGKEDVETFTEVLQSAIRLGTTYLNLCETGEVSHLIWKEEFHCGKKPKKVFLEDLLKYHVELEHYLRAWMEVLNSQRMQHKELNYFTAKQLLYMRKEIAQLRRGRKFGSQHVQLYTLLDSVLPGVNALSLEKALISTGIDMDFPQERVHSETGETDESKYEDLLKRYNKFFQDFKELGDYPEELALAAIVACDCPSDESELLMWCLRETGNKNVIHDICVKGANNPKYASLFSKKRGEEEPDITIVNQDEGLRRPNRETDDDEDNYKAKLDQTVGAIYLSLKELSTLLRWLANSTQEDRKQMKFPSYLETGRPNLILVPQRDILATVLELYKESEGLPSRHEVLICTKETTLEEVELLWRRALANTNGRFYCLVNAHVLSYVVSQQAFQSFLKLTEKYPENEEYKLVVICSSEQEGSHMVSVLDEYRVVGHPCRSPLEVKNYLEKQFLAPSTKTVKFENQNIGWIPAANVDSVNRFSVRVISSHRAGNGKSLVVREYSKRLDDVTNNQRVMKLLEDKEEHVTPYVIIPLHGKTAVSDTVSFLLPYSLKSDVPLSRIFHIDISPSVSRGMIATEESLSPAKTKRSESVVELDTLLFNLLLLGSIQDKRGRVWMRNPRDLYIVEVTPSKDNQKKPSTSVFTGSHHFFDELPHLTCITPKEVLEIMSKDKVGHATLFNEGQFQSEAVQRVFQYLIRFDNAPAMLHEFQFDPKRTNKDAARCLSLLLKYCGVQDPSWAELQHFVNFLNYQLTDCELSAFCQMKNVADTLVGFRLFVVRFMTIMAQDFSTPSLRHSASENDGGHETEDQRDIAQFQLRRKWESSPHPYIFFNPDHVTFTFLGFRIDLAGNLVNSSTGKIIKEGLMTRDLRTGLNEQRVDFYEDFEKLHKVDKIKKICRVLGASEGSGPKDPDESYELTEDNAKKMLAIHMRFRCGIPVVLMGETGCGKTKLIRYLCGLQKKSDDRKNMLLVKVHGGTTFRDIESKVNQAKEMAKENSKSNTDTVLFFDEVNTTEALDLVKEIMVDLRMNGRPIGTEHGLRFIAACNPYRKHTDSMIGKLESAGLGYSVKAEDTKERLGCVPLRHLVYRVHALPDSMRSLIWDFGQLKPEVELLYTRQIVMRHVLKEGRIPGDESLVDAITSVLAESQRYMREQSDECSFVSLRDVERTMDVMVWFYELREVFQPLLEEIEKEENRTTYKQRETVPDADVTVHGQHGDEETTNASFKENKHRSSRHFFRSRFLSMMRLRKTSTDDLPAEDEIPLRPGMSGEDAGKDDDPLKAIGPVTWSLILAIGVCYHAKLQDRGKYREAIARTFKPPCDLYGGANRILQEITRCQKAVLRELDLGPNIARNTALSENVFMMVVCIELRIPLFVIGKPGSSKSLAKTVVADNMQGDASKSKLFKTFKEVQMSAHQCSPLSTPEGIQDTFRQCANIQKEKNSDKFVSVVVLDEVGLAEDSPLMPLKTLHPLLEDGVTSSDDVIETDEKPTRVAFIGISNWALDPAKMNRGIMLTRDVPDNAELIDSAMGICGTDEQVQERMKPIIPALAAAYSQLYEQQKEMKVLKTAKKDEFFGLRDFYSLVKMLYGIAKGKTIVPDWKDVEYVVRRNFGGLDVDELDPVEIFMKHLGVPQHVRQEEENQVRQVSPLNLIKSNLDKDPSEEKSRYLLILTENHAALDIVEQHLKKQKHDEAADAVLIFGSSFPKDREYTQVCRNINDIKVCMETGRTVILLNMENLYEGLYDALNQYYVEFGGNQYVDLGLGTHRFKCRVHKQFRLIVIAEKDTVYENFPIPLINRLEKHFLVLSTSLTQPQEQLVKTLRAWVDRFAEIETPPNLEKRKEFTKDDAFVGYHEDTVPSVVLKVCGQLQEDGTKVSAEIKDEWEDKVLLESKKLLIQCCTPDAIVRVHFSKLLNEADKLWHMYFQEQQHSSFASFLSKVDRPQQHQDGLLIQVSTHSRLLSEINMDDIAQAMNLHPNAILCITLQQFQTELQFCDCVATFFANRGGEECLLIIQCNPEDLTFNLLACARHHLLKERSKVTEVLGGESVEPIHIIVIIQLPRMLGRYPNFVGFQGQRWESVHIDDLFTPMFYVPSLEKVKHQSLSDLFSKNEEEHQVLDAVLRHSVQAAAGRIEDGPETVARATKRIVILLNVLSKDKRGEHEHDVNLFSHALIRHVHRLLKEKDSQDPDEGTTWLFAEAIESSESGTYRKGLWQRMQNAVVPILSEVIAYMDRDSNLDLLQTDIPWLTELWIKIFNDDQLTQLNYDSFFATKDNRKVRSQVPLMSSGRDSHFFQCRFPFSWLLKEKVESMWIQVKAKAENDDSIEDSFRRVIGNSDVADIIKIAESSQEAMERYIFDFVHMNCKAVVNGEDELIARALVVGARQQHFMSSHDEEFVFPDISLVHKAYYDIDERLVIFSQLVAFKPDIVPRLLEVFTPDETEMTLDAIALLMCLESLEPLKINFDDLKERKEWCDQVIAVRASAERMLGTDKVDNSQNEKVDEDKRQNIINRCRPQWERLTAVRLFIDHLYPSTNISTSSSSSENIKKLCKVLDDKTDFSSSHTIEAIQSFLIECIESFTRSSADAVNNFRHQCNYFFMDLISLLCFGGKNRPKPLEWEVFETLMQYITGSSSSQATKNFSPFPDFEVDKTPVVRSFLLQQLLTISFEDAKEYLRQYLSNAQALSSDQDHVMRVCQLTVDCIEDSNAPSSQSTFPSVLKLNVLALVKGSDALNKAKDSGKLDIDTLEAIASVRRVMTFTAELLFEKYVSKDEKLQDPKIELEFDNLLIAVKDVCSQMTDREPQVFLLKQLARRYGWAVIGDLTQNPQMEFEWLIPSDFKESQIDTSGPDRFVVYNKTYINVRDALARGLLSGKKDELLTAKKMDESIKMWNVMCLLSIYREITCGYRDPAYTPTEHEVLLEFFTKNLSVEAQSLAMRLLANFHGMGFTALSVQPDQPKATADLAEVIVHAVIVLQCSNDNDVTTSFRILLNNPENLSNSYLPTMPEGKFQRHILGNANMSSVTVHPERNLSPAAICLIRLIMHSAMLVGGCRQPKKTCQLFSPAVEPERLNEFLWAHLTRDLRCLATALNRNEDEALLTVHMVLAQITIATPHGHSPGNDVLLKTLAARRKWEDDFTSIFIEPVLSTLDEGLQTCFDVMTNDNRIGTGPLMREIYEVDSPEGDKKLSPMNRCFWRYRASITVEHAKQRFSEQMKSDEKIQQCKVLQHFFKEEYRLRAVSYLPDINKLHKFLKDRFFRRINQREASEMTVKIFKSRLKDSEKKEFETLFNSFKAGWKMVRQDLNKGRFTLSSEICNMDINDESRLSVLLPSSDEESLGRCSVALVFYLVTAHNEFMETYLNITFGNARDVNSIRLPEVTCSQLVSYDADHDLLPLIRAHCHYLLEVGHTTLVEYDWPAIQRRLIDRFIRGKSLIDFQKPKFLFLRNNNEEMFLDLDKKIKQKKISQASAKTIMDELRHLDDVCDVKRSLEIAIGFLASSGGHPEQLISEYLHNVLCIPKEMGLRSRKANQHCQLQHIIHLWQLVTTKRAKIFIRDGKDPFEDLQDCFKDEIPKPVLLQLNKFLRTIDCSRFCLELLEMITFSLNEENEKYEDVSIKEFFQRRMDGREGTDVSSIPDELLLKYSVKTWENALEKSEEYTTSKRQTP